MNQQRSAALVYATEFAFVTIIGFIFFTITGTAHAEGVGLTAHGSADMQTGVQTEGTGGMGAEVNTETAATATLSTGSSESGQGGEQGRATEHSQATEQGGGNEGAGNATGTTEQAMHENTGENSHSNATSTETQNEHASSSHGEVTAEEHRSTVANVVRSLLTIADNEGGIGTQVREVAKSQSESASTTAEAMDKVDQRNPVMTFLFGSDYKNLGAIRAASATTSANISQLTQLLSQTTSASDTATLNAQIQALQTQQTQVNAFVQAHENQFSLFGWAVRFFVH